MVVPRSPSTHPGWPSALGPSCLPQPSPVPVMTPELRASRLRGCGPEWDVGWASISAEGHHAFCLVLGEDLAPSLSLTASWPRSPPHQPASSPTPSVNASSTGRVPPRRPPKYGGLPFRSALGDRSVHCCRWFAHRLRIQHGPRVRSRPVADASGAPVPPRPGTDWPAGHGKVGPSLGGVSEGPRVVSQ